ncbi:MAG: RdgB/HAM1 family non-canonical purine NTP pyrophosphatase [Vicinamibacterales bacterium]
MGPRSRLLIATTNPGKLREIRAILSGLPIDLQTLADHPGVPEPEETGATFAENARRKALHYAAAIGLPAVAEDSGLTIDALDGEPGVRSARYDGDTYPEKFANLFAALDRRPSAGSGRPERVEGRGVYDTAARFVCALALADGGRILFEAEGVVEGRITREPRGGNGFGYDPIFLYPPYGRTLAEASTEEKLAVSHRGRAFRKLRDYLNAVREI